MKASNFFYSIAIIAVLNSCNKSENNNAELTTLDISNITVNSAKGGGQITSDSKLSILVRGVCWSLKQNPKYSDNHSSDSVGFGKFSSNIINLNADSTYFVRAYYINKYDTVYGNQVKFTVPNYILFNPNLTYDSVSDIDGNIYKTIRIGAQTWMAENLKVTHYRNGDLIPNVTDLNKWGYFQITTGAFCWYKNKNSNRDIFGALYNWYAATDSRNIAPSGWHVPSAEEWQTLSKYLNPFNDLQNNFGYKLRETSTAHWINNIIQPETNNEKGFTALPGGKIAITPFSFMDIGIWAYFWTSTGTNDGSSCVYISNSISIDNLQPNCIGFSIRCVKN